MGVGVQGEACGEVAEHAGYGLDVYTVLQGQGGEGVAEVVEANLRDASPLQYPLQHIVDTVRRDGATMQGRKYILVIGFGFLCFKNFYRLR